MVMTARHWQLLRATSRSFYLSLRVSPARVREPIAVAYLLARTTDTVADAGTIAVANRLRLLETMRLQILGVAPPGPIPEIARGDLVGPAPEQELARSWAESLTALSCLAEEDRAEVRTVLGHIVEGQTRDLTRFGAPAPASSRVTALATAEELDQYTYHVAGSVGEFWSRLCRRHLFPRHPLDETSWLTQAVRFGKGLQLVNVLRDCAEDIRLGRCYLPATELEPLGVRPEELRDPACWPRVRPCYERWRRLALDHLQAGWSYTLAIPPGQWRLRLACAWPLLIGVRTLQELGRVNPLEPAQRIKVSRREVREWMLRSLVRLPVPSAWARLFEEARRR
ncbi:phytoene/squalene synthase family protein [Limisphaera sp. 4302-co]|uniref:phytoene/squalene synthase family protein n=1 Tax=Limisphaera sp. 4302-co TaxID=3400417 RepID=UPI003C2D7CB2